MEIVEFKQEDEKFKKFLNNPIIKTRTNKILKTGRKHTVTHGLTTINPMVLKKGLGSILSDVDNNKFIDFGSGVYVTNLGHSHPKISSAIAKQSSQLSNCHDHMTEIKASYYEQLSKITAKGFDFFYLYDNGTTAIEFAIRLAREITGNYEILSFYSDHHGKTMGASSLGRINTTHGYSRAAGFTLLPRPDPYRPLWVNAKGEIDTDKYIEFYELAIKEQTTGMVAAIIFEPIQGWAGTIVPPDDFFSKLKNFCKSKGILLIADEILTGFGRTGKFMAMEHWGVTPDIYITGKGMGNGFPMSALMLQEQHVQHMTKLGSSTTFGGNPVACASGLAVLQCINDENIIEQSANNGAYILKILKKFKEKFSIIGDVRGMGSILGIEFVKNKKTKEPFEEAGALIYKKCINNHLIPGIPTLQYLRLAPTLNISRDILDIGLDILEKAIMEVEKEFLKKKAFK